MELRTIDKISNLGKQKLTMNNNVDLIKETMESFLNSSADKTNIQPDFIKPVE